MILKSFKYFYGLLIISIFVSPVISEEKIDIWKNKEKQEEKSESLIENEEQEKNKILLNPANKIKPDQVIQIEENIKENIKENKVFGVHDPADYNFDLNMWSSTKAEDIRASLKRLKKIKLSKTSNEILESILLSYSYPPNGMKDDEFVDIKIRWLIDNDRSDLIESFLKQNREFKGKKRAIQYLVDQNIARADIKEGCDKIEFIDSTIKDSYLEKFKIYCLTFNNKNSEAQLLLDLLREQKKSDKFFDDKINYLLGITDKTTNKINEKNLLNFYLSSVTIKNFEYTPSKNTKKEIWQYLNAANLIKIDLENKEKLKELESAANKGQIDEKIIFDTYKQIPFEINALITAKNTFQTLEGTEARSLIYQKYLLSESIETKLEYLFLLEDLFKKDQLINIYSSYLSSELKEIGSENIPDNYREVVKNRIDSSEKLSLGKIKYNDKILHQSKVMRFYLENEDQKKIQKDIDKIFKRISKNRKYFYSAKDLSLVESLEKDGFEIPQNLNISELTNKYEIPKNLLQLIENKQNAYLALKIVEIIGEDEPYQLDSETIYFITNLLNKIDLIKIRNKVLVSALPQRV
tara:strand:+ start:2896 stop:4635 length:1740 start_codon:yes stop_codon:yes gene_type:complete